MSPSPLSALGPPAGALPHCAADTGQTSAPDPEFDALVAQHNPAQPKPLDHQKAPEGSHPTTDRRGSTEPHRPSDKDEPGSVDDRDDPAGQSSAQQVAAASGQQTAAAAASAVGASAAGASAVVAASGQPGAARQATPSRTRATAGAPGTPPLAGSSTGLPVAGPPGAGAAKIVGRAPKAAGAQPNTGRPVTASTAQRPASKGGATGQRLATDQHSAAKTPSTSSDVHPASRIDRSPEPAGPASANGTGTTTLPTIGTPSGALQQPTAGAASTGSGVAAGQQAPTGAIPAQLQPTVARLVSRGDGTHRMSMQLHPAALGEVRVTVTVKSGTVDVSLAAGPAAQDALRDGSAQLRSLLASSGHTLDRLVIQDLPAAAASSAQSGPGQGGLGQPAPQHGSAPAQAQSDGWAQGQTFGQPGQQPGQQSGHQSSQQPLGDGWSGDRAPRRHAAASAAPRRTSAHPAPSIRGGRSGLDLRI